MLVDSPPADPGELKPAAAVPGSSPGAPNDVPLPADQTCAKCGTRMALGQDWCLHCGAGAPGSIGTPGWRSAAGVIAVALVLALGAAAAGYAALSHKKRVPATVTTTVAAAAPPAASPAPGVSAPVTPAIKSTLPLGTVKPPKIPLTTSVPKIPVTPITTPTTSTPTIPASGTPAPGSSGGAESGSESKPATILLDTNAASTYNPYNYPVSFFGDPSLTIDGDSSTAWTAQIDPATAPKLAEGVLIDLKGRQKVSALKLTTSSPGMTVQVYGAESHAAPASITDHAWIPLSHFQVVAKKHVLIKLKDASKAFTFVTLWISNAPAAAVGTPQAPGHISVNEIELFPAG
jgi:hypothetical protein